MPIPPPQSSTSNWRSGYGERVLNRDTANIRQNRISDYNKVNYPAFSGNRITAADVRCAPPSSGGMEMSGLCSDRSQLEEGTIAINRTLTKPHRTPEPIQRNVARVCPN